MESNITQEEILRELVAIGFARVTDFLCLQEGSIALKELPPDRAAAIASLERTVHGPKIKLYDKLKALELLGKRLGMFEAQQAAPGNNLLQAIVASTDKEVDISDIPELQQTAAAGDDLVESSGAEGT